LIAIGVIGLSCVADEVYAQVRLRQLMIDKLQTSQKLLEAIAKGDFKQIGQQADRLSEIANQAEWMAYKTPKYEVHSNEFRRAAETISRKAKDKNLDGVTLAYFDLTMSCVRCHQYTRDVRDASLPYPRPGGALAFGRLPQEP
jgi:cytochrome c556